PWPPSCSQLETRSSVKELREIVQPDPTALELELKRTERRPPKVAGEHRPVPPTRQPQGRQPRLTPWAVAIYDRAVPLADLLLYAVRVRERGNARLCTQVGASGSPPILPCPK